MSHFLLTSSPIYGHLAPMLTVGRGLRQRGHRVDLLTGSKYRTAVEDADLTFLPLPAEVDYDDADLDAWLPGRDRYRGLAAVRHDLIGMFARPIPGQHRALTAALAAGHHDAVVSESAFMGVLPTMLGTPATQRIPLVGVAALPVTLTSVDTAPFGPGLAPGTGAVARLRNRVLNTVIHRGPLRPIQDALHAALDEVGAPHPDGNFFDQPSRFDVTFQLSPSGIEYPRRELPESVRFVGPLRAAPRTGSTPPAWWSDLDGGRPVVHVTQGTIDNADLDRLLVPTIRALAEDEVLVVASTGGRPVSEVVDAFGGALPANARVAEFLPYDQLLPRTDVVVTNGGFGGVQQALANDVPMVVAGATEDKPEVAARVAWSGSGIDLRTGTPSPERIRRAVRQVIREPRYAVAAARIGAEIRGLGNPMDTIAETLEGLVEPAHRQHA